MTIGVNFNISQSQFQSLLQWSAKNGGSSSTSLNANDIENILTNDTSTGTSSGTPNYTTDEQTILGELVTSTTSSGTTTNTPSSLFTELTGGATTLNWTEVNAYESNQQQSLTQSLNQLMVSMGILPDISQVGTMDADDPDACEGVDVQFQ
jgi:hypothetical protein